MDDMAAKRGHNARQRMARRAAPLLMLTTLLTGFSVTDAAATCRSGDYDCEDEPPIRYTTTTAPSAPAACGADKGMIKVSIEQIEVRNKTHDTWFDYDGKGDEIFHQHRVQLSDRAGNVKWWTDRNRFAGLDPYVMGDVSFPRQARLQEGSATSWGSSTGTGGLMTGDKIHRRFSIFDGELVKGGDKVTMVLGLAEWDEYGSNWLAPWANLLSANAGGIAKLNSNPGVQMASTLGIGIIQTLTDIQPSSGTRQIGVLPDGKGGFKYDPPVLTLDFEAAKAAASGNHAFGPGYFEYNFADGGSGLEGAYNIILRVQCLAS